MVYGEKELYRRRWLDWAVNGGLEDITDRLSAIEQRLEELEAELRELRRTAYTSCDEIIECTSG